MSNKLLILDGTSLLAEAYYSSLTKEVFNLVKLKDSGKHVSEDKEMKAFATLLQSKQGTSINGVQGFFKTLFDALDKRKPSHVAITWGAQRENNFRRKIFPGYKDDGKVKDKALLQQETLVKKMLSNMNIYQIESLEYEALDIAGSLAETFKSEAKIEILARNTMSLQFTDVATVWFKTSNFDKIIKKYNLDDFDFPRGSVFFDEAFLLKYKMLKPEQMPDYRALLGHSFSNVQGVSRVGEVTTIPLLQEYGIIENLYSDIDACTSKEEMVEYGNSLKKELSLPINPLSYLIKYRKEAFLGKDLARYRRDILGKDLKCEKELKSENFLTENINKVEIVRELKTLGLAPIKCSITKKVSEIIEQIEFSSLIATYDFQIHSPQGDVYTEHSIDCVPVNTTTNNGDVRLIHISDEAILAFGDKIKIDLSDSIFHSSESARARIKEKEKRKADRNIAIITSSVESKNESDSDDETPRTQLSLIENEEHNQNHKELNAKNSLVLELENEKSDDNEIEHEIEYECENSKKHINDKDSDNNNIQTSPNNKNSEENKTNAIKNTANSSKKGLSLIESIVINRYYCSECDSEFTLVGSTACFCTSCGAKTANENNKASDEVSNSEQLQIPIAEKSKCNLNGLKLKESKKSLEHAMTLALA